MKHTAQWWAERVAEFAQAGGSRAVARRHGVNERTLVWWRSELRRRVREGTGPRLLPVVVSPAPPRVDAGHAAGLEVFEEVGVARMTMRGAVSPEHLAAIVPASTRTC